MKHFKNSLLLAKHQTWKSKLADKNFGLVRISRHNTRRSFIAQRNVFSIKFYVADIIYYEWWEITPGFSKTAIDDGQRKTFFTDKVWGKLIHVTQRKVLPINLPWNFAFNLFSRAVWFTIMKLIIVLSSLMFARSSRSEACFKPYLCTRKLFGMK